MDCSGLRQKRLHSAMDDCDECSPISKRINRLQIEAQKINETVNHQQKHHLTCGAQEQSTSSETVIPSSCLEGCCTRLHEHNVQGHPHQCFAPEQNNLTSNCTPFLSHFTYSPLGNPGAQRHSQVVFCTSDVPENSSGLAYENTEGQLQCCRINCRNLPSPGDHFSNAEGYSVEIPHPFQSQSSAEVTGQHFSEQRDEGMSSTLDRCLVEGYSPDLDEGENPHYYQINQMLFDAHCTRLKRFYSHRTQLNSV